MKIVSDRNMPYAKEAFETLGETLILEGRSITNRDVLTADMLAIRSTTRVNADLLAGSRVRFVGTATIGTDHLDIPYLEQHGIQWCFSPGCNANSVSEYITAALLHLATKHHFQLAGKTIGVIGVGNVGRLVVEKARALGMTVVMNDPPRKQLEQSKNNGVETAFVELDELLQMADVISLHVPITKGGTDKTFHLADKNFFGKMRDGCIFINAARGAVVDTPALLDAIKSHKLAHVVLDTWEGEPDYNTELLDCVDIATPHIAGHSFEGKVAGTVMVYKAACVALETAPEWTPDALLPPPLKPFLTIDAANRSIESILNEIVSQVYDIMDDDRRMRSVSENKITHFDNMRKSYPMRREFRYTTVNGINAKTKLCDCIEKLGFKTALPI